MAEYRNARENKARELGDAASAHFERGVSTRETGDRYVRVTVLLATVLLLTALSQRFKITGPRIGVLVVAFAMLGVALYWIATFPRA